MEARLSRALDQSTVCLGSALAALCPGLGLATPASIATDADVDLRNARDWSFGWNAGLMWEPLPGTRVGAHYRSKISHNLEGTAVFGRVNPTLAAATVAAPGVTGLANQPASARLTLPESASVHFYHELNDQWALHGDVSWTRWTRLQRLIVKFADGTQSVTPFNWNNTMRYSGGVTYRHNDRWTFRAGAAYDETPIPSPEDRTPRLPGEDRTWVAIGVSYAMSDHLSFDAGFAHLFIDDAKFNNTEPSTGHTLTGKADADANILSAQVIYKF